MKVFKFVLLLSMAIGTAGLATAETWEIDPVHSTVGFKIRHFFTKQAGEFNEFSGTIVFDPEHPEKASVSATIQAASIDTDNENRDNHLRSGDFFDVENHPTITFESTNVETKGENEFLVTGELTMHGITKTVTLPVEFLGSGPDAWGGTRAGFTAELKVDRKDYDITWNNVLDTGGTVLGDEVTITLEIEAAKAKPVEG